LDIKKAIFKKKKIQPMNMRRNVEVNEYENYLTNIARIAKS